MVEGSRAGLHISCCGHVVERLVKLLADDPSDKVNDTKKTLPPISRIDACGFKNLSLDVAEFENFAESTALMS